MLPPDWNIFRYYQYDGRKEEWFFRVKDQNPNETKILSAYGREKEGYFKDKTTFIIEGKESGT